jgi:hypothetical protein
MSILEEAGWTPGTLWTGVENRISCPHEGSNSKTVQSVVSCYANYAILGPCDAMYSSRYVPMFFGLAAVGLCFETSVHTA